MSDTYCKQLYRDITSNYYQEFTSFMTKHWYPEILGDSEITQEERQGAYQNFYKTIKDARIANRQTIRRWFGLSEQSIPSRTYIFRIALAAGLSVEETEEYLQLGISQQGIQDNDYREFIARYCLDHGLGIDKCRRMIEFYERKSQNRGKWEQESNTNWVREQYTVVRDYPEEEFLVWMHKHQKYFKGYSLTVLKCYRQLVEECLIFLRKDVMESLAQELQAAGFMEWREQKGQKGVYGGTEIERFSKIVCVRSEIRCRRTRQRKYVVWQAWHMHRRTASAIWCWSFTPQCRGETSTRTNMHFTMHLAERSIVSIKSTFPSCSTQQCFGKSR